MNDKFLSDYIVLFINSQNDLLETIINNKSYEKIELLKNVSKVVTKTIANSYDVLYELNNKKCCNVNKINELEKIRKTILKNDVLKIYDHDIKKQVNKNLHYAETLESIMLQVLPDVSNNAYVTVSRLIELFEILDDLFN